MVLVLVLVLALALVPRRPPCCTGNQARLLPNYIHHTWTATKDNGLAAAM